MEEFRREHRELEQKMFKAFLPDWNRLLDKRRQKALTLDSFWPVALGNSEITGNDTCRADFEVFKTLQDVWVQWDELNPRNYSISMQFDDSRYLRPCTLVKQFSYNEATHRLESRRVDVPWKQINLAQDYPFDPSNNRPYSFMNWFYYENEDNRLQYIAPMLVDFYMNAHYFYE